MAALCVLCGQAAQRIPFNIVNHDDTFHNLVEI